MSIFKQRKHKPNPSELLSLIGMMDLWTLPVFKPDSHEIMIAASMTSGVVESYRPVAVVYIAENGGRRPMTGTVSIYDESFTDDHPDHISLSIEGRPFAEFRVHQMWAPRMEMKFEGRDRNAILEEVRAAIGGHWENNWYKSTLHQELGE